MNKFYTFGCGQGATKAMLACIENGTLNMEDCCIVNSTHKDIPEQYRDGAIIISDDPEAGCGKVRSYAKKLMVNYLKNNPNDIVEKLEAGEYQYVNIMATTEGASGSGASVVLAAYLKNLGYPVIITLITGFENDNKGLSNTIEYFKDLNGGDYVVRTVSNKKFLDAANNNVFIAEKLANEDISKAFNIISASGITDSDQNIDATDHFKLITNPGMMFVAEVTVDRKLKNPQQFDKLISDAIDYNTSLDFEPSANKLGIFMNLSEDKLAIVDTNFTTIKKKLCGGENVNELFIHRQYNPELPEFVRIVATGMNLPKEELMDIYTKFKSTATTAKKDDFFSAIADMDTTVASVQSTTANTADDIFAQFDTNDDPDESAIAGMRRPAAKRKLPSATASNNNGSSSSNTTVPPKKKGLLVASKSTETPYSEDSKTNY